MRLDWGEAEYGPIQVSSTAPERVATRIVAPPDTVKTLVPGCVDEEFLPK
jgi:hypothetical protein